MATVVNFGGKKIIEPGVYALIKSGIPAAPTTSSFGNVCIIDTGSGKGFGGGSGTNGSMSNGVGSVYSFDDINDFQQFVRGGLLWDLAPYIFNPASAADGPNQVMVIRAATTTPAEIEFIFSGGASDGGSIKFLTKNEGEGSNGYTNEKLAKGKIIVNAPIVPGDTVDVEVDEGSGAASILDNIVTAVTSSASDMRTLIIDAINSSSFGYGAHEQAGEIIVTAKKKSGVNANTWPLTTAETGSVTTSVTTFSNGVDGTKLSTGYAAKMSNGDNDPLKFKIDFYEGTYKGISPGGNHYGGLSPNDSSVNLIASSIEFDNIDDLIQWAKDDYSLQKRFELDVNWTVNGSGAVDASDLINYPDLELAVNGTADYAGADLDKTLKAIREIDNTFFLCDRWGDEAKGTQNTKILDHILNNAEFDKFMVVGGGIDETKFDTGADSSIAIAKYYDSPRVTVVHSGHKKPNLIGNGYERVPSIYHAANVVGRLGGLEPQVPATFKELAITDFLHSMGITEREKALQNGVLHNRNVPGIGSVVNQAINSLQRNSQMINPDGSSFEISVMRIGAQLNKEIVLSMRPLFVGNNVGSASPADIKLFVERHLLSRTATDLTDNLILSFKNVTVRLVEDYYDIKYGFVPNGPINKLFVTGFMLDANLSA